MIKTNKTKTKIQNFAKIAIGSLAVVGILSFNVSFSKASEITPVNLENLINSERVQNGLIPLKISEQLNSAASNKSEDMVTRNYFEHYAFGLTPWNFIVKAGYNYLYAGENLAMDFDTAEGTVNAWMESPAHRKNILNSDFSDMGMGVVRGEYTDNSGMTKDTTVVTNMFGREKPVILQVIDAVIVQISKLNINRIF